MLFFQLAQKKEGQLDGQIESLRHQHERGRNHIAEILGSLDGYSRGNDLYTLTLLENLAAYISLLRHHIHKEDHNFYPMAEKELSKDELLGLDALFDQKQKQSEGKGTAESRKLIHEMASLL